MLLSNPSTNSPVSRFMWLSIPSNLPSCWYPRLVLFVFTICKIGALEKKLQPEASSALAPTLAIHPSGDHVLMASSDGRVTWFDLDLASRPYQTLTGHSGAVRSVSFHPRLLFFASASTDGTLQICPAKYSKI